MQHKSLNTIGFNWNKKEYTRGSWTLLPTDWYIEISCTQCSWNASLRSTHMHLLLLMIWWCCVFDPFFFTWEMSHSTVFNSHLLGELLWLQVILSAYFGGGGKHRCHPPLGKKKPVKDDVEDSDAVSCGCLWHAHNSSNRRNSLNALCLPYASISVHVFEVWCRWKVWKVAEMRMWPSEEMSRYESM